MKKYTPYSSFYWPNPLSIVYPKNGANSWLQLGMISSLQGSKEPRRPGAKSIEQLPIFPEIPNMLWKQKTKLMLKQTEKLLKEMLSMPSLFIPTYPAY